MAGNWLSRVSPFSSTPLSMLGGLSSDPDYSSKVFQIGIREINNDQIREPAIVWRRVQDIFTQFCKGSKFQRAEASWYYERIDPDEIQPHEMVVYLVRRRQSLIARNFPRAFAQARVTDNTLGLTFNGTQRLSEVYYDHPFLQDEFVLLGNIIVHELMHNKLNMGNEMHDLAPFTGSEGGFLQDTMPNLSMAERMSRRNLQPTGTDIRTMAPALSRNSPQFLG